MKKSFLILCQEEVLKKNNKNKKTTRKYLCMKMKTLRFLIIYKAGKIIYDNGCKILKLTANKSTE